MSDQETGSRDLQVRIVEKAWADEAFKAALMRDPRATLGEELGVELPEDLEIEVVEETSRKLYLVLPAKPELPVDRELSDQELEAVAGGTGGGGGSGYITYTGFDRMGIITPTTPRP
jgi:hypothetical protein